MQPTCVALLGFGEVVAWKGVLVTTHEDIKNDVWKLTKKKRERLKGVYFRAKAPGVLPAARYSPNNNLRTIRR